MNTHITDTIACDTARLNSFVNSGNYDYNSEIGDVDKSLFEKAIDDFNHWLQDVFDGLFDIKDSVFTANGNMKYVWMVVGIAIILALLYLLYKKKMFFFKKKEKEDDNYEIVEDSIYGVDFEQDISRAIRLNNYREAVRLRYLQCLKLLSDHGLIDWRIHKTPAQYTQEYKERDFRSMTHQYVLIRYGDYTATSAIFDEISLKYQSIEKEVSGKGVIPPVPQVEGGENET